MITVEFKNRKYDKGMIVKMKKILILGGGEKSLSLIEYAVKQGYYTILCDYLLDNPGQHYVDEYHCISATDSEAVLKLATKKEVDGVVSYSSDLIALTTAYVGNKLNLPSNLYNSVLTLARKDLFRKFLKENGFNCPRAESSDCIEKAKEEISKFSLPFMVKPIDSAGSTGVVKVEEWSKFDEAFINALKFSKEKRVIIEEYIQMDHECMIAGDAFVLNGKVEFIGLLNSHRSAEGHPFIPTGTSYPIFLNNKQVEEVTRTVQQVVNLLHIQLGGLNLELMYDNKGDLYIVEIAPRNGGNLIPELLNIATGIDLIGALVDASVGIKNIDLKYNKPNSYYSTYVLHSKRTGKLKKIKYKEEIEKNIIDKVIYVKNGDDVFEFDSAKKALGILFLKFHSLEEEQYKMNNMDKYIDIELNEF